MTHYTTTDKIAHTIRANMRTSDFPEFCRVATLVNETRIATQHPAEFIAALEALAEEYSSIH